MPTNCIAQQNVSRIIRQEHEQLAAVIQGMRHFVALIQQGEKPPKIEVFRAMLFYMNEYPERVHHPKEDRYLFARLRMRTAELDNTLAALEYQHALGAGLIHGVALALTPFELEGASAFPALYKMVDEFACFYDEHMRLEEQVVFPAAGRYLTEEDWLAIDAAFSKNQYPLNGPMVQDNFDELYAMLVKLMPAPSDHLKNSH